MYLEWTDDFDFPGGTNGFGHSLRGHTINNWIPLAIAAVGAAASVYASSKSGGGDKGYEPKILPETVSGNVMQDLEFLFDQEAADSMKQFTAQLNEWGEGDRDFFETQFQPFQQDLMRTNQAMLPLIEKNSTAALDQNVKDLLGSEHLKASFRENITTTGADIGSLASNFARQIENIPGESQRVGEALSAVEQRFGQAGAELKRAMNAKGVGVSEASQRDLAISKATAKAGAAGVAAEGARREKLQATAEGVGVLSGVQGSQSQQLLGQQGATQAGAMLTPQVGGVQDTQSVGKATELGAGLTQSASEKMIGSGSDTASAEFTQVGVQVPKFFSGETGNVVTGSGEDVKSMELTHAESMAAALEKQRKSMQAQLDQKQTNQFRDSGGPGNVGGGGGGGVGPGSGGGNGPGGGAGSGVCCFVAGTQIMTEFGDMHIEDIKPGFEVLSYNFLTGKQIWSAVKSTMQVIRTGYYHVEFKSGMFLKVTNDHPMWTNSGWQAVNSKAARENSGYDHLYDITDLKVGSGVSRHSGDFDNVLSIKHVPGEVMTYTLRDVTPAKNFYANGYLASNKI